MAADLPTVATAAGADVSDDHVRFRLADPRSELVSVRLVQDVRIPGEQLGFRRDGDGWALELPRPDVWRMEYLFTVERRDGTTDWLPDPANPARVAGAFGDKSVLEFPDYRAPDWLSAPSDGGRRQPLEIPARSVADSVTGTLWSPDGTETDEPLPMLVVHDGPEYDALAQLTTYLGSLAAAGHLPRVRAALLSPGPRDDWYSGNGAYTRALCLAVVPRLRAIAATTAVVGVGASLGALALLHAQRRHANTFDALFLQSGSFFHPRFDAHERRFAHYDRIVRSVDGVLRAGGHPSPVPVVMTCGRIEENLENNRTVARALGAQGYDVALHELPDVHNYTAWRDAFDPHLTRLLRMVAP